MIAGLFVLPEMAVLLFPVFDIRAYPVCWMAMGDALVGNEA